jgi:predicted DCC family thiol-disulfide oxidoreductase YuxK
MAVEGPDHDGMTADVSTPGRVPTDGGGAGPVLLFDGFCGLCNGTVRVVIQLDPGGRIRFAPLDGDSAAVVFRDHPELREVDSLVLVERPGERDERVLVKTDAVLGIARHLGGVWRTAAVLRILPRPLRDWGYDFVARHRYAVFGRFARRPPPPTDVAERFLD